MIRAVFDLFIFQNDFIYDCDLMFYDLSNHLERRIVGLPSVSLMKIDRKFFCINKSLF
jgi:hypothetical protein